MDAVDPTGLTADSNFYRYVRNSVANGTDPYGLDDEFSYGIVNGTEGPFNVNIRGGNAGQDRDRRRHQQVDKHAIESVHEGSDRCAY